MKLAEAFLSESTVSVQLLPLLFAQASPQLENLQPLAGAAVRTTCVPGAKYPKQVAPQSIPDGELVTLPLPLIATASW